MGSLMSLSAVWMGQFCCTQVKLLLDAITQWRKYERMRCVGKLLHHCEVKSPFMGEYTVANVIIFHNNAFFMPPATVGNRTAQWLCLIEMTGLKPSLRHPGEEVLIFQHFSCKFSANFGVDWIGHYLSKQKSLASKLIKPT